MYFATPAEAEQGFYSALSDSNLEQMKSVWLDDPDVTCIHPMVKQVTGYRLVIGSFRGLFEGPGQMSATITDVTSHQNDQLAIHTGCEIIHQDATEYRMQVTNSYRKTDQGWRMILHHSSPIQSLDPPSRVESNVH